MLIDVDMLAAVAAAVDAMLTLNTLGEDRFCHHCTGFDIYFFVRKHFTIY